MEIRNRNGALLKPGVLANDILKEHLSTRQLFEKRQLEFVSREEFLACLGKVISNNKKLLNSIKKELDRNDLREEKQRKKESRTESANSSDDFDEIKSLENCKSSIMAELKKKNQDLEHAKAILNEAKKGVESAKSEVDKLIEKLRELEQKIEIAKNKIYLVAPGYVGDIPEFGRFYSISNVEKIANIQVVEVNPEFLIKPDFEEMIKSGYDSAQEYTAALRFVMLCEEHVFNGEDYTVLNSDKKIKRLLDSHIGE